MIFFAGFGSLVLLLVIIAIVITSNKKTVFEEENNLLYGSVWGDEIGDVIISFSDLYYNVTAVEAGELKGFIFNKSGFGGLTATKKGFYEVNSGWSFSGGANTEYHLRVSVNNDAVANCHAQRKIGTGGDVGSASTAPCIVFLKKNDVVGLQIENTVNINNAFIHDVGLTIVRLST